MKTVICRLDLGYTRIAGYLLYDSLTQEFQETTPKDTKELVKKGEVNGLVLLNNEIELDEKGFKQKNLMIRTGVGKYRPLKDTDSLINRMYAVVDVVDCGGELKYEIITNYCGRKLVTEDFVKNIFHMGYIAGVDVIDDSIKLCAPNWEMEAENHGGLQEEYSELPETAEAELLPSLEEEIRQVEEINMSESKLEDTTEESVETDETNKKGQGNKNKTSGKKMKTKK